MSSLFDPLVLLPIAQAVPGGPVAVVAIVAVVGFVLAVMVSGVRYIPNSKVGVVEKLWSGRGSVTEGRIISLKGEAGLQVDLLRGGLHFGYWFFQYRVHLVPLVTVPQGKLAYVYARDGESLAPSQTLGRVVPACNDFQDARAFLVGERTSETDPAVGQRGRQRQIIREGVYAINLGLFVVMAEDQVYRLQASGRHELETLVGWQAELKAVGGFSPVIVGGQIAYQDPLNPGSGAMVDGIGIVTVQDGPSLGPGEIIAPAVGVERTDKHFHNNYQDPEAFLRAGGYRGRQYYPLTDGTYFINRWFASVEMMPKTVVPIGYVGVVVSYYGRAGQDVSGDKFRHGERVAEGERGVLERPFGPGKYAFNTYAGVIQRFGDVKKLITQTLDPMLSAYFRDVAHKRTMLALLHERDSIQLEAREELRRRFSEFDIECVDVLIGKPDTAEAGGKIETLLEQLRMRQLSIEQIETFERQRAAEVKQQTLNEARAEAGMQAQLTQSLVQVRIAENEGEAALARARKQAEQMVVIAQAESQQRVLAGRGEGSRLLQVGLSEASVLLRKIQSYSDPRLFALAEVAEKLAASTQPLVPERMFVAGGQGSSSDSSGLGGIGAGQGVFGLLLNLLVAEKSGFHLGDQTESTASLQEFADRMTREAMESMPKAGEIEELKAASEAPIANGTPSA
jgi:uncharacterized membrane protein YqiK